MKVELSSSPKKHFATIGLTGGEICAFFRILNGAKWHIITIPKEDRDKDDEKALRLIEQLEKQL